MATKTAISEQEYLSTSFEHDPEYRDGELIERAIPVFKHGTTQGELYATFRALRSRFPVHPTVEMRMKLRPRLYRIPDAAVFLGSEPPAVPDTPPLVAIEILSADDRMPEVLDKLREYRAWGVPHIWLVDPESRWMYIYDDGLREVGSLKLPELDFELQPADVFGV